MYNVGTLSAGLSPSYILLCTTALNIQYVPNHIYETLRDLRWIMLVLSVKYAARSASSHPEHPAARLRSALITPAARLRSFLITPAARLRSALITPATRLRSALITPAGRLRSFLITPVPQE